MMPRKMFTANGTPHPPVPSPTSTPSRLSRVTHLMLLVSTPERWVFVGLFWFGADCCLGVKSLGIDRYDVEDTQPILALNSLFLLLHPFYSPVTRTPCVEMLATLLWWRRRLRLRSVLPTPRPEKSQDVLDARTKLSVGLVHSCWFQSVSWTYLAWND